MSRVFVGEFEKVERVRRQASATPISWTGILSISLLLLAISAVLALGWLHRNNDAFTPAGGLGYGLGIAGATLIALVLLYPLRKHLKFMRSWARLAHWFRWHMVCGCLGPTLVVVHAKFSAQSLNGLMALSSTLIVASSGVVGRYLYVRIHRGLYGAKLEARELLNEAIVLRPDVGASDTAGQSKWQRDLKAIEEQALAVTPSLPVAFAKAMRLEASTRRLERVLLRDLRRVPPRAGTKSDKRAEAAVRRDLRKRLAQYFRTLRRAGSFAVYERMFALWHVLHLPLIVLLVATAIIHVIAVHLY